MVPGSVGSVDGDRQSEVLKSKNGAGVPVTQPQALRTAQMFYRYCHGKTENICPPTNWLTGLPRQPYSDSAALGSSWAPGQQKVLKHQQRYMRFSNVKATTVKTHVVVKHQLRSPFKTSNITKSRLELFCSGDEAA